MSFFLIKISKSKGETLSKGPYYIPSFVLTDCSLPFFRVDFLSTEMHSWRGEAVGGPGAGGAGGHQLPLGKNRMAQDCILSKQ